MYIKFDGDFPVALASGQLAVDETMHSVPDSLLGLPLERLRLVGGYVVDAAVYDTFYIDAFGRKHLAPATERQALACAWDARIVQDGSGQWRLWTPPGLPAVQAQAASAIDDQADARLAPYISLTPGRAMTYLAKEAQARQFLEAAEPDPTDYPLIAGEVGITADTAKAVAETILAMAKAWHTMGGAIEAVRLAAKKQVRQAPTPEAVQAVLAGIVWPEEPTA